MKRAPRSSGVAVPRWVVLLVALLLAAGATLWVTNDSPAQTPQSAVDPVTYSTALWEETLGGDDGVSQSDLDLLGDLSQSDLSPSDAQTLAELATAVWTAEVSGEGRESYPEYFPVSASPETSCTQVSIEAVSPMALPIPGIKRAKVLVAWRGQCPDTRAGYVPDTIQVGYVYAIDSAGEWLPEHDWELPRPAADQSLPEAWELKGFSACGSAQNTQYTSLIIVVDAFEEMCSAAQEDGVSLVLTAGLRTPQEQQRLFEQAVEYYGSREAALRWVAFSDGKSCASKHCTGAGISIEGDPSALAWLQQVVGCNVNGEITLGPSSCSQGSPVRRMQRYGFLSPAGNIPTYLEFYLPVSGSQGRLSECNPAAGTVPQVVASVWRCRLQAAGISGTDQARIVAEALVVSRCESGWNPAAVAFGGRYVTDAYPSTGRTYDNTGVFMLTRAEAEDFVDGGATALTDPVANASGAASLWLATRSWDAFGCATGKGDAFETGPVLPQYEGPDLPEWASAY